MQVVKAPRLQRLQLSGLRLRQDQVPSLVSIIIAAVLLTELSLRDSLLEPDQNQIEAQKLPAQGSVRQALVGAVVRQAREQHVLQRVRVHMGDLPFPSDYPP